MMDNILYVNTASIAVLTATGSLNGTASYALNISPADTASYAGYAQIAGVATQSLYATQSINAYSASWVSASVFITTAQTASYYKIPQAIKSGQVPAASFGGTPLTYSVVFAHAYPDTNYSMNVIGGDARVWTVEIPAAASCSISTNSTQPLTSPVYWMSIYSGESV